MRRALIAVLGVAILLGSAGWGTTGGATQTGNDANTTNGMTMIRVSSVGEVEAEPNQAILRVAVVQSAADAETVRERLAQNSSRMQGALRNVSVSDDRIRTVSFDITQDRDEDGEPAGFRGIHAFEITINDTERAGQIIDTAVRNGANEVGGVEFTVSDARSEELRANALREAMQSARADAETIAGAENLSVVGVQNVSSVEQSFVPVEAQATTVADAGATTAVESGPVTVSVQVVVTYEAQEESE
ncbi:SIMPL domain-containing protein [Haladaptatus sp. DFWS20]|uniref:SIMPL domain-containing protein n=1 Tax=Haladaptatus sp. DFWS20 TaxID=3403467 RepID=UPI003EBC53AF